MEKLKSNFSLVKCLMPYYKKNLWVFLLDLVFAISTSLLDLSFPIMVKIFINLIEQSKPDLIFNLIKLGFFYILILTLELVGTYYVNYIGHCMGAKIETSMRNDLFAHCHKLPFSYHDNNKTGQIISRLTNDLSDVGEFAHHAPEDILIATIKIIIPFTILFDFNWALTLIIYFLLLPMFMVIAFYFKKMKISNQKLKMNIGELSAKIEDSLLGLKLVKSLSNEKFEQEKFAFQNNKVLEKKVEFYKAFGSFRTFNRFAYCVEVLIFILGGALLLKNKVVEGTTLFLYTSYVDKIMAAVCKLLSFADTYQKGLTGINRFCEVMESPIVKKSNNIAKLNLENIKGKIEFKNVSFSYEPNSKPIIKNFNLKIVPNEKVALIGPSGAGKTTICNLLENFFKTQQGEILIDDININRIDSNTLHEIVGLVQQNVYLITGTILDNIQFGRLDATFEEIIEASKKARIFDFINSLENKFNTNIGERGTKLSGGQKQQISIARLFLRNPKILILDEATSSLDSENEKIILQALNELSKNKTTITIAHKLHTVKNADKIYLMQNGTIVESGNHDELIKNKNSLYHKYYNNLLI